MGDKKEKEDQEMKQALRDQQLRTLHAMWAIERADARKLAQALAFGADPNGRDEQGFSLARQASMAGFVEGLKALRDAGADLNARQPAGETILGSAARQGIARSVAALLGLGADPEARDAGGKSALAWACLDSSLSHELCVKALLGAGADPDGLDEIGWTPLMRAAVKSSPKAIQMLIGAGANLNRRNGGGFDALSLAALRGRHEALEALLNAGADLQNCVAEGGALALARQSGSMLCVALVERAMLGLSAPAVLAGAKPRSL